MTAPDAVAAVAKIRELRAAFLLEQSYVPVIDTSAFCAPDGTPLRGTVTVTPQPRVEYVDGYLAGLEDAENAVRGGT